MNILIHYVIALLTTAATLVSLGIFVYLKNRKGKVNQAFAIFVLSAAIWSFGESLLIVAQNERSAIFLARLLHSGVIFIPACFLHFIFELVDIKGRRQIILKASYMFSLIFFIFNNFTKLLLPSVSPKFSFNYYWNTGILYPYYFTGWLVIVIYGLYELRKAYLRSTGAKRNQLRYVFWAPLIGYAGGVSNYLPAFNIEIFPYNPFGTYGVPIFSTIIAYAIIKYGLMDISVAIGKLATYLVLLTTVSSVYLGLMWGVDRIFSKFPAYSIRISQFIIFLLLSTLLIYLIPRLKGKTEEGIAKVFFKNRFKYRDALREFSKRLVLIPGEEKLLTESVDNIAKAFDANRVAVILMDDLSGNYIIRASYGLDDEAKKTFFMPEDGIIKWLKANKKIFLLEEVDKIISRQELEKIRLELKNMGAVIYLPLIIHNELGGLLVLGEKNSREMYSHIDIELLEDFASQLALSVSYKRMEYRMMRADKLVSLGTLAASMAHEIRNPLSSIQIFAQLLPQKYDDKEFREEFSKVVFSDAQRINRIIESVMALANPRPSVSVFCNANELLDETLFFIETNIKKNGVKVIKKYDGELPHIKADSEQLRQVFLNIFLNALSVIPKDNGQLTISTRQKIIPSAHSGRKEKYIQIEVKDNGIGIDKKLLERIFEPFFTTRADGTGLGLAIVHRIVEQHSGFVHVDSEPGKGAAFFINLPMKEEKQ